MTRVQRIGHSKVCEARSGGVYAAKYHFDKRRVFEDSGTEIPFVETAFLLKLPGRDGLWLQAREVSCVIDTLTELLVGAACEEQQEPPSHGEVPLAAFAAKSEGEAA